MLKLVLHIVEPKKQKNAHDKSCFSLRAYEVALPSLLVFLDFLLLNEKVQAPATRCCRTKNDKYSMKEIFLSSFLAFRSFSFPRSPLDFLPFDENYWFL